MARATDKRWKGHLIDWPTIQAMDAEDYELKPLNQQQVAILLMLLTYQKWTTRWTNLDISDDELQKYIGDIEERLMRNEGGMATKDDIRDGMYEALNRLAAQIVSGRYTNIEVSDDGTVSDPSDAAGDESTLPEDDPLTELNETLAAQNGGAIAVRTGVNQLLADLALYFGSDTTEDMPVAQAQALIAAKYKVDIGIMNPAIATYWGFRAAGTTVIAALNTTTLDNNLFCKGVSHQTINNVVLGTVAISIPVKINCTDLMNGLTNEQLSDWFTYGSKVPSTAYITYTCTKIQTEQWVYAMQAASVAYSISGVLKANHRYQFEFSGSFTDVDNPNIVQDAFYSHNLTTGIKTYIGFTWSISGITAPTTTQVPFQADHIYSIILDKTGGDNSGTITKLNNFTTPANTVGSISAKMTDMGEYAL